MVQIVPEAPEALEPAPIAESVLPEVDLPQVDLPQVDLPQVDLPQVDPPQVGLQEPVAAAPATLQRPDVTPPHIPSSVLDELEKGGNDIPSWVLDELEKGAPGEPVESTVWKDVGDSMVNGFFDFANLPGSAVNWMISKIGGGKPIPDISKTGEMVGARPAGEIPEGFLKTAGEMLGGTAATALALPFIAPAAVVAATGAAATGATATVNIGYKAWLLLRNALAKAKEMQKVSPIATGLTDVAGSVGAAGGVTLAREVSDDNPFAQFIGGVAGGMGAQYGPAAMGIKAAAKGAKAFHRWRTSGEEQAAAFLGENMTPEQTLKALQNIETSKTLPGMSVATPAQKTGGLFLLALEKKILEDAGGPLVGDEKLEAFAQAIKKEVYGSEDFPSAGSKQAVGEVVKAKVGYLMRMYDTLLDADVAPLKQLLVKKLMGGPISEVEEQEFRGLLETFRERAAKQEHELWAFAKSPEQIPSYNHAVNALKKVIDDNEDTGRPGLIPNYVYEILGNKPRGKPPADFFEKPPEIFADKPPVKPPEKLPVKPPEKLPVKPPERFPEKPPVKPKSPPGKATVGATTAKQKAFRHEEKLAYEEELKQYESALKEYENRRMEYSAGEQAKHESKIAEYRAGEQAKHESKVAEYRAGQQAKHKTNLEKYQVKWAKYHAGLEEYEGRLASRQRELVEHEEKKGVFKTGSIEKNHTARDLIQLRQNLLQEVREESGGKGWGRRRDTLQRIADAVLVDINEYANSGKMNSASAEAIITANDFTAAIKDRFSRGPLGALFDLDARDRFKVAPSVTLENLFTGSPGKIAAKLAELPGEAKDIELIGGKVFPVAQPGEAERLNQYAAYYIKHVFRQDNVSGGKIDASKAMRWMEANDRVLSLHPEVKKDLVEIITHKRDWEVFQIKIEGKAKNLDSDKAIASLVAGESPELMLDRVYKSANPGETIKQIQSLMKASPDGKSANAGLQKALFEHILEKSTIYGEEGQLFQKHGRYSANIMERITSDPKMGAMMGLVFTENQRVFLRKVIESSDRLATAATVGKQAAIPDIQHPFLQFLIRAVGGKAGSVFARTTGLSGPIQTPGAAIQAVEQLVKLHAPDPKVAILRKALMDAENDPEFLKHLLVASSDSREKIKAADTFISSWLGGLTAEIGSTEPTPLSE